MKTIRQWLEGLPPGYREATLANARKAPNISLDEKRDVLSLAISGGFVWADVDGGYEFWAKIYTMAGQGKSLPPYPFTIQSLAAPKGKTIKELLSAEFPGSKKLNTDQEQSRRRMKRDILTEASEAPRNDWPHKNHERKIICVKNMLKNRGTTNPSDLLVSTIIADFDTLILPACQDTQSPSTLEEESPETGFVSKRTTPNSKNNMDKYNSTPVATPTLVYGQDVSEMDDRAIIRTIQSLQAAKKKNDDVGVVSTYLRQENAKIDSALKVLVSALDKLAEPEAAAE